MGAAALPTEVPKIVYPADPRQWKPPRIKPPQERWPAIRQAYVKAAAERIDYWLHVGVVTIAEYQAGLFWYEEANQFAQLLSENFAVPLDVVIDIIAGLSARNRWEKNKDDTRVLLVQGYRERVRRAYRLFQPGGEAITPFTPFTPGGAEITYGSLPESTKLSWNLLIGAFYGEQPYTHHTGEGGTTRRIPGELTGNKRLSFAANIRFPRGGNTLKIGPITAEPVTVDVWAWRAAIGVRTVEALPENLVGIKVPDEPGKGFYRYNTVADAYRLIAARYRLLPLQTQAIVWSAIRNTIAPPPSGRL